MHHNLSSLFTSNAEFHTSIAVNERQQQTEKRQKFLNEIVQLPWIELALLLEKYPQKRFKFHHAAITELMTFIENDLATELSMKNEINHE